LFQDRLFYCALKAGPTSSKVTLRDKHNNKVSVHFFSIDNDLVYWNFFLDFGPLNLGQLFRFSQILKEKLEMNDVDVICFYSSIAPAKRANAIYLICAWQLLHLKRSPEEAAQGFNYYDETDGQQVADLKYSTNGSLPPPAPLTSIGHNTIRPLPPFHDASPCACTYELSLMHCLQGLEKAVRLKFFDWDNFDIEEYEYYEQVEVCQSNVAPIRMII
jgi:cell division cycle 14